MTTSGGSGLLELGQESQSAFGLTLLVIVLRGLHRRYEVANGVALKPPLGT